VISYCQPSSACSADHRIWESGKSIYYYFKYRNQERKTLPSSLILGLQGWVAGEIENRTKLTLSWVKAWLILAKEFLGVCRLNIYLATRKDQSIIGDPRMGKARLWSIE